MSLLVIISVLVTFIIIVVGVFFILDNMERRKQLLQDRLERITGPFGANQPTGGHEGTPIFVLTDPNGNPVNPEERPDFLPTLTHVLGLGTLGRILRLEIMQAGLKLKPAEFAAICVGSVAFMAFIGIVVTNKILVGVIMGIIGYIIPIAILKQRQTARRQKFDSQIVDTLSLVASSLRTGYSFMHAMEMVVNEMPAPISEEFAWARGECMLGVPVITALQRMVDRVRSYDMDLVTTAVAIQLQVGGNLAEILDTIANTIRERVRIKGEINGLTAEGKLSGLILFLMPIALGLFLDLRQPEYFRPLLLSPIGAELIIGALVLQLIGGLIIKKLIDIDV
jgi:tight adherence protein B